MEKIESHLNSLLHGKAVSEDFTHCDFTLAHQNEIYPKGVAPAVPNDFKPVLKNNVTYIVCMVVINDIDEILMIQEAKSSIAGSWYLPAGRMEPGETIEEAAKREMLEETGLHFEMSSLLVVQCAHGSWVRFVLVGDVVAGKLKTTAEADEESLQAKWIGDLSQVQLRSSDILPLIEHSLTYKRTKFESQWHERLVPALKPHNLQLLRTVVIVRKRINNQVHVLVSEKPTPHLPVCEINPTSSVYSTLKKFMQNIFPTALPPHKPHGVLALEHLGKPPREFDGFCLNLLVSVRRALEDVDLTPDYTWLEVEHATGQDLLSRIEKNMTVMLHVIR